MMTVVVVIHSMSIARWSSVGPIVGLLVVIPPARIIPVLEMGIAAGTARFRPNSRNSNFDLSVRMLHGNESQSTYHERN
jgi:hypothetical protein